MLYVKTRVGPSPIQGLGLFADEPIPMDTLIARYDSTFGWACTEEQWKNLPPIAQDFVSRYGWRVAGAGVWLMDVDDSRFMNHSYWPNMLVTTESGFTARAARDIEVGEELTEDYSQFDPDFETYSAGWSKSA